MNSKDIIVIGAAAGGFEAMKMLVSKLSTEPPASVFIVWHMSRISIDAGERDS